MWYKVPSFFALFLNPQHVQGRDVADIQMDKKVAMHELMIEKAWYNKVTELVPELEFITQWYNMIMIDVCMNFVFKFG
jgi:hypothetical protein